jgi:T5orf172 domain
MPRNDVPTTTLIRHFERMDGARTAEILFDLARKGTKDPLSVLFGHPLEDEWRDFAGAAARDRIQKRRGTVYVVANPVHAGLYKIGVTKGDLSKRLRSLKTAGVVGEFLEIDQFQALDRFAAEKMAHRNLSKVAQRHKEFFATDWKTACGMTRQGVDSDNKILKQAFSSWMP